MRLGSSDGKVGISVNAQPMLECILRDFALPLSLLGPVLFCALRWLAAI